MSKPEIAGRRPIVLDLTPGEYWWCACGRSGNQPWCDGSHAGTDFHPVQIVLEEDKRCALCLCKHTKNAPYCDGAHKTL